MYTTVLAHERGVSRVRTYLISIVPLENSEISTYHRERTHDEIPPSHHRGTLVFHLARGLRFGVMDIYSIA